MLYKNHSLVSSTYFLKILREAELVSDHYPSQDTAASERSKLENIRLLDNQYAYIFDLISHKSFSVLNTQKAIGFDESYFTDLTKIYSLILPEDVDEIARISLAAVEFYKTYEDEFRAGKISSGIFFHRIVDADKEVKWVMRQTYLIYSDIDKNALLNCSVVTVLKDNALDLHACKWQYVGHRAAEFNQLLNDNYPVTKEKSILTLREIEIIRHVNEGANSEKIADMLSISVLTVRKHRANIMQKLGLSNTAQLITYAKKTKLG
jgi:DNA-binding CsgD family transcriptional regulator